jgi:phage terminase large subunit
MNMRVNIPSDGWQVRDHQEGLWNYLQAGGKRAVAVWHRRAGKDEVCLHHAAVSAMRRPGNYWHMLPEYAQARKAIWDSVNPHTGRRRIDEAFPHELRDSTREHDMHIRFRNGSTWACVGSDSVTSGGGIGSSTAGIVFSEWSLANPSAWGYYRPIIEENNGWAVWISTPRGRNHLLTTFQHAQRTIGWFAEILTAHDTGALSHQALAEALSEYIALYGEDAGRAMYESELMCSFTASVLGSFYAIEMRHVREEGRISDEVVADPARPVDRYWDLGMHDDTSIWFAQSHGTQLFILDHVAASGRSLEGWRDEIEQRYLQHGWKHGTDWVPHDAKVKELGTGRTRVETMQALGLKPMLVPWSTLDDGINAVRRTLTLCAFHPRCEEGGISALEQYRREWDDDKKAFRASAVHDWTSHPADAFRYLAMAWRLAPMPKIKQPVLDGWRIPLPDERRRGGIRL